MDNFPLYKDAESASLAQDGNRGLWYDKFCSTWLQLPPGGEKSALDKDKWIGEVAGVCGNGGELRQYGERQKRMIGSLHGRWLDLRTSSPFVSGLGRAHPVENGFAWHYTLGVPYLPGSSVKGMVRAWVTQWKEVEEAARLHILGSPPPIPGVVPNPRVGAVVFLDALPAGPVELGADVMTPHYGAYYQSGEVPGDWMSPTPIPFLVVKEGVTFRFAVAPRQPGEKSHENCTTACAWLKEALEWIGAGAKTAVGYGRMRVDEDAQRRSEQERIDRRKEDERKAALQERIRDLPEDAARLELQRQQGRWNDVNAFLDAAERFLADNPTISNEGLKLLADEVVKRWPGILEDPDAVRGKRKKPKYRTRPRALAKSLNARREISAGRRVATPEPESE